MSVTAPPRPPRPDRSEDPLSRQEIEALVEALIDEVRRETRRRRRKYWAFAGLVTFVGVVLLIVLDGGAASQTASPALSARSSLPAATATSKIAYINEGHGGGYCGTVWVMNADGSGQRRLTNGGVPGCGGEWGHAWSPNGREIAFVNWSPSTPTTIYVMNADGSGQRELTRDNASENSPSWSPDGRLIAFVGSGGGNLGIYVTNADGKGQQRLLARDVRGNFAPPAWSPDGGRIAFVARRDGNVDLYVVNTDGSGQRRLTSSAGRDSKPAWSPDGRRIAFESKWQVYVMNADGSGQRRLTNNGGRNFAPAWSPDGRRIVFERRVGREQYGTCPGCGKASTLQVYVVNADGSDARKLAQDAAQPVWSPDGRKIAFEKIPSGTRLPFAWKSDIYVMNSDGSGQRHLTRGADRESQPVWSPAQK
jgi:Tol biopolymer transport system component